MDDFLFWDAMIVVALILVDWLLGKERRRSIKERVGWWWLWLSELSFRGLIAEDARRILMLCQRIFGEKATGAKCIGRSIAISLTLSAILVPAFVLGVFGPEWELPGAKFIKITAVAFATFAPFNALLDWVSVVVTMHFLTLMSQSARVGRLLALILADLVVAALLGGTVVAVGRVVETAVKTALPPGSGFLAGLDHGIAVAMVMIVVMFTSLLPTLIHMLVGLFFLLSKVIRPILQQPTALVLQRLYESERGILTLLAAGVGGLAKLLQEGTKYLA